MALSPSARVMKCKLKKRGMSDQKIMHYLAEHGYFSQNDKKKMVLKEEAKKETATLTDITEETWKNSIIRLLNEADKMTPAIIDKIRDYLDKKNAISQAEVIRIRPSLEDVNVFSR